MTDPTHHECDGHCADLIEEPGKFEGEPRYVRDILYAIYTMGDADASTGGDDGGDAVHDWIREPLHCEAMAEYHGFEVWNSNDGFFLKTGYKTREEFDAALGQAMKEEVEAAGPQEEDLTTEDDRHFYQNGKLAFELREALAGTGYLFQYVDKPDTKLGGRVYKTLEAAINAYTGEAGFYPNVWRISDHGNAALMEVAA